MPLIILLVGITGCMCTNRDLFRRTVLQKCRRVNNCSWDHTLWVEYLRKPTIRNPKNSAALWRIFSTNQSATATVRDNGRILDRLQVRRRRPRDIRSEVWARDVSRRPIAAASGRSTCRGGREMWTSTPGWSPACGLTWPAWSLLGMQPYSTLRVPASQLTSFWEDYMRTTTTHTLPQSEGRWFWVTTAASSHRSRGYLVLPQSSTGSQP